MNGNSHYLNLVWQQRIHIASDALEALPAPARECFESVWDLGKELMQALSPLPAGMLHWWLTRPAGHIVIHNGESSIALGTQVWRGTTYQLILYLDANHVVTNAKGTTILLIRLVDLLLGSAEPGWSALFSAGHGVTPELASAARRLVEVVSLGYSSEELGAQSASDYFTQTLYLALHTPRDLNRINPLLLKFYQQTLLSDIFWNKQLG
ncbi:MAG: hypothetical protein ACYC6L_16705 [Anaerolineae bacterium]